MNKLFVVGRLGSDPEVRSFGERTVTQFSCASDTRRKDAEGNFITNWYRVSVWGKTGENCAKFLHKGDSVVVEGDLTLRSYVNQNGETRWSMDLDASDVQFLSQKDRGDAQSAAPAKKAPPAKPIVEDDDELPF